MSIHEPMPVIVVEHDGGDAINPPLDAQWSELDQLRWLAGTVVARTGLDSIRVTGPYHQGIGVTYGVNVGQWSNSGRPFHDAWTLLIGIEQGAEAMRQRS